MGNCCFRKDSSKDDNVESYKKLKIEELSKKTTNIDDSKQIYDETGLLVIDKIISRKEKIEEKRGYSESPTEKQQEGKIKEIEEIKNEKLNEKKVSIAEDNSGRLSKSGEELKRPKTKSVSEQWKQKKKKNKDVKETHSIIRTATDEGVKTMNNYQIMQTLGQGAFGKVKLAIKKIMDFEKKFAIKVYKKANLRKKKSFVKGKDGKMSYKDALQSVAKEIAVMKKLDHPNVVRLHEILDDEEKDKLYMVLDFASNGQLIEWDDDEENFFFCQQRREEEENEEIDPNRKPNYLSEERLRDIFREALSGLHYLHLNHIIHRDIKPQNLLFDESNHVKIADFGQSFLFDENDKMESTEGTYWFMAPELLDSAQSEAGVSGAGTDIWSLGVTFFVFTYLQVPFYGNNIFDLLENIKTKELEFPDSRNDLSDGIKNFLKKMIEKDPSKRTSLVEFIHDPWLNIDREPLEDEIKMLEKVILDDNNLEEVVIPLERTFFLKKVAKKFKQSSKKSLVKSQTEKSEE